MNMISEWLHAHAHILTVLQISLDLCLILLILLLVSRKRRNKSITGNQELTDSLEKIIAETKQIAAEFDTNLQERKLLIQQIISKLDDHLEEARKTVQQFESMLIENSHKAARQPMVRNYQQQDILRLAKEGHEAASIAAQLKKPIGEVELILKLQRLSDK